MGRHPLAAIAAAIIFACAGAAPATAAGWQCVTYARTISGVDIHGNANTWWRQAAGRYARGNAPQPGAVLAFKPTAGMPIGHVAVVAEIVSPREIRLDHANWSRRGGVEHNARAIDVSAAGDWSEVRVTYDGAMGARINPTWGFIYPTAEMPAAAPHAPLVLDAAVAEIAAKEATSAG